MPAGFFLPEDGFAPFRQGLKRVGGQLQQGRGSGLGICQPGVEHALHLPSGFAERGQAHHAAAAFEGVEGAAQVGELRRVGQVALQRLDGVERIADDFGGFFQKDVAQVFFFDGGVDNAVFRQGRLGGRRGQGGDCLRHCVGVFGVGGLDAVERLAGLLRQRGLSGKLCLLDDAAQLLGGRGVGERASSLCIDQIIQRRNMRLPQLRAGAAATGRGLLLAIWCGGRTARCADGYVAVRQFLCGFVEVELRLGQGWLVGHHVDHEGQGTQAVAELEHHVLVFRLVDGTGFFRCLYQLLHLLRHGLDGPAGILEVERQQNARDFVELADGFGRLLRFLRVAEKVVQRLLYFTDAGVRFGHDLGHAVLVVEARVKRLHPFGGRLHVLAALHGLQPLRQQGGAFFKELAVAWLLFGRGFQKEDGCCHFHGDIGVRRLPALCGLRDDAAQRLGKRLGRGPERMHALRQCFALGA